MPDPEVKVVLTAEDQGVAAAIRQLGEELKNLKTHEATAASGALNLRDAFRSLIGALSLYSALDFGKKILDDGVAVGNLSRTIGVSSSTVSVFKHVSEETGVSWERIGRSLAMGARRITEFMGGEAQAAEGMKLLGLTAKDFVGLNADQKLNLMVQALGRMPDGFSKAAAAQILFSRGGKDMVVVANAIARQGFGRIEDELRRMGVLMDDNFTNKAAIAQAGLHTTKDVARGLAVEFESGLLPAISDVGEGLLKTYASSEQASNGFVLLGQYAGVTIKLLIVGFDEVWQVVKSGGEVVELVGGIIVDTFETVAKSIAAAAEAANGDWVAAIDNIRSVGKDWKRDITLFGQQMADNNRANKELTENLFPDASKAKSFHDALFGTPEGNKKRMEEMMHALALDQPRAGAETVPSLLTGRGGAAPEAAAHAQLALALKQQQDLLAVWKASATEREEIEKQEYENGTISIEKYFADRRAAIQNETAKEIAVLKQERDQVQAAANLEGSHAAAAGAAIAGAQTPQEKHRLAGEEDRYTAEKLNGLARVDELNTRISEAEIASRAKLTVIDAEQFKTEVEQKKKILEFLHQIQELQGNATEGAKAEVEAKIAEMRVALDQMKGQNVGGVKLDSAGIDQLITKYRELKAAVAGFGDAQHDVEQGMRQLELDRTGIDEGVKTGQITQMQAEREYMNIVQQEIPLLERKAQVELSEAVKTGDQGRIQQAQQTMQQIRALEISVTQLGQKWKQTFNQSLSQTFDQFASRLTSGTKGIVQSFASLEMAVVGSLEHVAAQMLANALTQKAISEGTKLDDAKTAAANVYAQVSGIPVIGWILAPVAAAAAFAAVLAFEKGGIVPGRAGEAVPILAHANEMVLPADISTGMRSMIETGMPQPRGIASLHDFSRPSFDLPENIAAGAARNQFTRNEYHLHHNGPDALEVLQTQLVPMIKAAHRAGSLDDVAP